MPRWTRILSCGYGFYVATHPWLMLPGYVKVGCTANLSRRLEMTSFTTCFTPEWRYFSVFECESMKKAFLLEQAVLFLFKEKRVPHRELIKANAGEVTECTRCLCTALNIDVDVRLDPVYERNKNLSVVVNTELLKDEEEISPTVFMKPGTLEKYMGTLERLRISLNLTKSHVNASASDEEVKKNVEFDQEEDDLQYEIEISDEWNEEDFVMTNLRPYQEEAFVRCRDELKNCGATICQMACRCGKTPVAFKLIEHFLMGSLGGGVLYLVPGLALLRQTVKKLYNYGLRDVTYLLIGSFTGTVYLGNDRSLVMTTDLEVINNIMNNTQSHLVVISTYQSSHMVSKYTRFILTVFDECHRACGNAFATNFNSVLLQPRSGMRLFLTATPAYDTPIKMDNTHLFGGIAYRYYLREGIDAGYVNSFALRIILGESMDNMNPYIYEAMRIVNKMIVYCRNIEHAEQLTERLRISFPVDVAPFSVLLAHSRMGSTTVANILQEFYSSKRAVLLNVRLFQEGVEIPDLNAVFFAAPRYSSRDIVQSICRPLNKQKNKPKSYVFLPATFDKSLPDDDPVNLQKFSTLIPFTDALMDEDPLLFEYLIDPHKVSYDIDVVGVRSLKLSSERIQRFVLPAIRRGVRYSNQNTDRLHRAARLPWKPVFAELRRIVLECNRYPKTNDAWVIGKKSVSMALFYRFVRRGYRQYLQKEPSCLKMHQIRDLESLPLWETYGMQGPYPWEECLRTLRSYLKENKSVPPLDVHKGGYIGLDATPFERLCGTLMHVNQCDAHDKLRLDPGKQKDLDDMCKLYGLIWRKKRDSTGKVIPGKLTFITESYGNFKRLYENRRVNNFQQYLDVHFPGYPEKHERMEDPRNLKEDRVPPRHVSRDEREKPLTAGKVMCRVCRRHITVQAWEQHLKSNAHLKKTGKLFV